MREKTFDEIQEYFQKTLNHDNGLKAALESRAPDLSPTVFTMLDRVKRAASGETALGCVKTAALESFCHTLPYLALERDDGGMAEFVDNFVLLLQNYSRAVGGDRINTLADTLGKLTHMRGSLTELLILTKHLISQYSRLKGYMPETIQISRQYIKQLTGEE